jgi:hypothetical protein
MLGPELKDLIGRCLKFKPEDRVDIMELQAMGFLKMLIDK